jgi:hypothetical protein
METFEKVRWLTPWLVRLNEAKFKGQKEDNIDIPCYRCEVNTKERWEFVGKQVDFCWESGGILWVSGRI